MRTAGVLILALLAAPAAVAQGWPVPDPADVTTLDGIMRAYYEVVSGSAGTRMDWDRDKSLHIPEAQVVITRAEGDSLVIGRISISQYHEQNGPLQGRDFFEYEIARQVRQHGSTVHVWSTYEWKRDPEGEVGGRGINSIEMVWDGTRYWITSWGFDGRGTPVPIEYLPQGGY